MLHLWFVMTLVLHIGFFLKTPSQPPSKILLTLLTGVQVKVFIHLCKESIGFGMNNRAFIKLKVLLDQSQRPIILFLLSLVIILILRLKGV
jgi:hypothetical protein